ncbi:hypothetical protein NUW54_g8524 [Trametes sanguinea]|uniref:Uncharacterized protein n=1 Tax=Trametes sanguinea TaxID=158606 RepID=A0ACC1PCR5_9APHY|nr:hypothetical protein NUW54_g8524 [Trametes sanguinea]
MSSWKTHFTLGTGHLRAGRYQEAIDCFSEALHTGGDAASIREYRAAAYQKVGKLKDALRDAKTVIDLRPDRWQGYARSARLFHQGHKYDAASRMVELALERVPADQARGREGLISLKEDIDLAREAVRKLAVQNAYHFGNLPVEIATRIFSMALEEEHTLVLTLAQVCKNWRLTVLGTPAFWGTLVLGKHRPKQKVKLWRQRARDRFSALAILDSFSDTLALQELQDVPLDTLRVFRCEGYKLLPLLASISNLSTSVLASLDTLVLQSPYTSSYPICAPDTPELKWRILRFARFVPENLLQIAKRSTHLTSITLDDCPVFSLWSEFLLLLHRNPALTSLELSRLNTPASPQLPEGEATLPEVISLPVLEVVTISSCKSLANSLLPRLAAPSLKALLVASHSERLDVCMTWLAQGPAATLTALSLQRSPVQVSHLTTALKAATSLQSLQITHLSGVALAVLELLATPIGAAKPFRQGDDARSARRVHCPALRHLNLSHCPDVAASLLIAMVKLRLPETQAAAADSAEATEEAEDTPPASVQPLESLIIDGCPNVDAGVLPWLRAAVPSVSCIYLAKEKARWKR